MTRGRSICNVLKSIRKQIADANGIHYAPKPCGFKGECRGTCPACEAEVKYIERELNMRRMAGKAVTVLGLSVGMASLTACHETPQTSAPKKKAKTEIKEEETEQGDFNGYVPASCRSSMKVRTFIKFTPPPVSAEKPKSRKHRGKTFFQPPDTIMGDIDYREEPHEKLVGDVAAPPNVPNDNSGDSTLSKCEGYAEVMPQFPGGNQALFKYIADNFHYPTGQEHVQGRIVVKFVVERDGSLSNVKVVRSVDPLLDKEALRMIYSMPKWIPGTLHGKVVRTEFILPFKICLQ